MIPFWKKTDKHSKPQSAQKRRQNAKPAVPRTAQQSIPMQRMLFSNSVLSVAMFTKDSSNLMLESKKFRKLHHSSKMAVLSSCWASSLPRAIMV